MKKLIPIAAIAFVSFTTKAQTLKDAIRLNENEQHDAASSIYQQLISKEPTNGTYYYYYGENLMDAENPDSAKIIFEAGLQKDPTNGLVQIGLAELSLEKGDMNTGKPIIDVALKIAAGKNALVLMEAAEAYIHHAKAQDLISAQSYLDQAAKLDPKNPEVYNLMGDIYSEQNNGSSAALNYNKAIDLDKANIKAVLHKGQLYKRSTNYDGAIEEFNNTLKIDPNFAPAYRELGEVNFKLRKLELAKDNYKKYLELSKNNTNARLRYAYFLYESSDYINSLNELANITRADSTNLGMMRIMAYVNCEGGKNDTALNTIKKVFEITANDTSRRYARDYSYYGKILAKTGNDSLGAQYIKTALSIDPKQSELYDDLADLYNKSKKFDLAARTFEDKIANVNKTTTTDRFNLGRAWYSAKDYVKADTAFAKVTELNPSWPNGYFWRGRSNAQIDTGAKQGLANPYYAKFISLAEADTTNITKQKNNLIEANSYLAYAAFVAKDCKLSIELWNKVLSIEPTTKQAKDAIESIKNSKDCK